MTGDMAELDDMIARLERSLVIAREFDFAKLVAEIEKSIRAVQEWKEILRRATEEDQARAEDVGCGGDSCSANTLCQRP
jgi:hypothetical protein